DTLILNAHPNDPSIGIGDRNLVIGNFTIDFGGHNADVINLVSVDNAQIFDLNVKNVTGESDALDFDGSENIIVTSTKFFDIGGSAAHVSASFKNWNSFKGSSNVTVSNSCASN